MAEEKIRVLRVLSNLGGGGVQRRLLSLLPYLNEKWEINLLSFKGGILEEEFRKRVKELLIVRRRSKFDPVCISKIYNYLKKRKIHILHTHTHKPNTTARIAGILAGVPIIIAQEHNLDTWKGILQRFIDVFFAGFTDRIVVVSKAVGEFYHSIGIPREKIYLLYNGIEYEKYILREEVKEKAGKKKGELWVGYVGRLHPQKGVEFLIKGFKKVSLSFPQAQLLIIGEGPLKDKLLHIVEEEGIQGRVKFMGRREDLSSLLPLLDILVLPSLREGFPNVILEAMASSLPVIASDTGGVREVVEEGITGYLVPPKDVSALAARIKLLLQDQALREEMGRRGREKVKKFHISRMAEETIRLYTSLLKEKGIRIC